MKFWKSRKLIIIASVITITGVLAGSVIALQTKPKAEQQSEPTKKAQPTTAAQSTTPANTESNAVPATTTSSNTAAPAQAAANISVPAAKTSQSARQTSSSPATPASLPTPVITKPTYTGSVSVKSATLSLIGYNSTYGSNSWRYSLDMTGGLGATMRTELQFEYLDGSPLTWPMYSPLNGYKLDDGSTTQIYDVMKDSNGLPVSDKPYRVRLHVIAPNEVYSNWLVIS